MKNLIILLFSLIFLNSCVKDEPAEPPPVPKIVDTILPGDFYPVYPGSSWTYEEYDNRFGNNITKTVSFSSSAAYVKHCYKLTDETVDKYSDTVLVPFYNGPPLNFQGNSMAQAVYGYNKVSCRQYPFPTTECDKWPILLQTPGAQFDLGYRNTKYPDEYPHFTVIGKSLNVNGDSILTISGKYIAVTPYKKDFIEYTKNVGMTLYYSCDTVRQDTVYSLRLTSYHINK